MYHGSMNHLDPISIHIDSGAEFMPDTELWWMLQDLWTEKRRPVLHYGRNAEGEEVILCEMTHG